MNRNTTITISVRGEPRVVSAIRLGPRAVATVTGTLLRVARIHDELWLASDEMPSIEAAIDTLRRAPRRPDVFTFAQRVPNSAPAYPYRHEWQSFAVASFASYQEWFDSRVDRSVRKHVRKSIREGVVTEAVPLTDELVHAISAIYNESPVRQGRPFWHFGKSFETVKADNATYPDRSVFVVARHAGEIVGFLKFVHDGETAAIMQIVSKLSHADKRPTNALIAKAIELGAARGLRHLIYGQYAYGTKQESSLIDFKQNNGFVRMDVPRYFVPLTRKGSLALALGLHKELSDRVPAAVRARATAWRTGWYRRRQGREMRPGEAA